MRCLAQQGTGRLATLRPGHVNGFALEPSSASGIPAMTDEQLQQAWPRPIANHDDRAGPGNTGDPDEAANGPSMVHGSRLLARGMLLDISGPGAAGARLLPVLTAPDIGEVSAKSHPVDPCAIRLIRISTRSDFTLDRASRRHESDRDQRDDARRTPAGLLRPAAASDVLHSRSKGRASQPELRPDLERTLACEEVAGSVGVNDAPALRRRHRRHARSDASLRCGR